MHNKIVIIFLVVIMTTIATVSDALAYIDPGSGSLLIQLFIAILVSVLFWFRKYFSLLISLFFHRKKMK